MQKKLVRYDNWHFVEVDPVRLKRTAIALRDQILDKIEPTSDRYGFYAITLPILEAAIRGEIVESLDEDNIEFVPGNYRHDRTEGLLPPEFDRSFTHAVADFSVTVQGLSMEPPELVVRDGATYGWVELEDEGDWPNNVKFP